MHTTRLVVVKQTLTEMPDPNRDHQRSPDYCMHTARLVVVKQM